MYKKTLMTGTIIGSVAAITAFLSTGLIYTNIQHQEEVKQELLSELEATGGTQDFQNTEGNNGEEIVVDDRFIEIMPKVEDELNKEEAEKNLEKNNDNLPLEINLEVPFYSQAPEADWSLPWKEACEEASLSLAYHFVMDETLNKEEFKNDVLGMTQLVEEKYGAGRVDTNVEETAEILEEYFDYTNYKILENPSIEDLKSELAQGHPIVAPFAGKELGNGFFTNGGPRYHMLVIVGYNSEFFLTNDVGTSRGENFAYSYDTIMNALHDFEPSGDITLGAKKVLVLQ